MQQKPQGRNRCYLMVFAALLFCASFTGCVYKLDIQQGNIIERDKLNQVQLGMSKRQVRYLLGTPLIVDTFNQERWDYYFSIRDFSPHDSEGTFHQEHVTLTFEKGQLSKIDKQLDASITDAATNKDAVKPPPAERPAHEDDQ